jgi:hypothetical protein
MCCADPTHEESTCSCPEFAGSNTDFPECHSSFVVAVGDADCSPVTAARRVAARHPTRTAVRRTPITTAVQSTPPWPAAATATMATAGQLHGELAVRCHTAWVNRRTTFTAPHPGPGHSSAPNGAHADLGRILLAGRRPQAAALPWLDRETGGGTDVLRTSQTEAATPPPATRGGSDAAAGPRGSIAEVARATQEAPQKREMSRV